MATTTETAVTERRRTPLDRVQMEVLRKIIIALNRQNEAVGHPGFYFLAFEQNFGAGKIIQLTGEGDSNTWIAYRHSKDPYEPPTVLTYWLEWLLFNYVPDRFGVEKALTYYQRTAVDKIHPIQALTELL